MKYARLDENETVVEVIEFDPEGRFTQEIVSQFTACPDEVEQNWTCVDGGWSAPAIAEETPTPPTPTPIELLVAALVTKGTITQDEADMILATL